MLLAMKHVQYKSISLDIEIVVTIELLSILPSTFWDKPSMP